MATLAERLLQALRQRGATEVFGIPGDFALPLFREFERCEILPLYTFSHEPALGFAADAAARARGGLGVAAVTYGAGALNIVNAVAGAYAERVPLVVLSGAPAAHEAASGYLLHHQVKTLDSQWRVFSEITADRARLDDAQTAPQQIARVLDAALRLSRPVYLEIPRDMPGQPCGEVPPQVQPLPDPDALDACADELLLRLRRALRPVLMVGVEVRRYGLEARVAELARRLAIPVVTSFMGRGLFDRYRCAPSRHLPRPGGRPRAECAGRRLGRAAAARRDRVGHQLRGVGAAHRPASRDPGARRPRGDGPSPLPGRAATGAGRPPARQAAGRGPSAAACGCPRRRLDRPAGRRRRTRCARRTSPRRSTT